MAALKASVPLLLLLAALPVGCAASPALGPKANGVPPPGAETDDHWPFRPASIEIHPLTRIIASRQRPGRYIIEARVEFLDEWDCPTKAIGELSLEIRDLSGRCPPLYGNVDLSNLELNARQYEPVTQSYLLVIDPDWTEPPLPLSELRLRALMVTPDGEQLQHQIDLLWPGEAK